MSIKNVDLSIIVVASNVKELVRDCFTAIWNSNDQLRKEVIYVDNGSTDGTVQLVKKKFPKTIIIESQTNLGFIRANNLAYPQAKGKYILMLNSDAFVGQNTLQETCNFMDQRPDCGVVGCRLVGLDGHLQPSARYFMTPWNMFLGKFGLVNNNIPLLKGVDDLNRNHDAIFECDWVPGCYLLTRKKIIDEFDFFLRPDFFMYFDDIDLCLRIKRKGWKVFFYPHDVVHIGGVNNAKLAKVTPQGKQIEKYNLESEFIYFRKNYHVGLVLADFLQIIVVALLRALKRGLTFQNRQATKQIFKRIVLAFRILKQTQLGQKPIH